MNEKIKRFIPKLPRYIIGITFVLSGIGKMLDPEGAKYLVELMASEFYWLVEWEGEIVFSVILVELLLAGFLLLGKQSSWLYVISFLFVGMFTSIISYFLLAGFNVESCGCFGAFGLSGGLETTLIRNIVLLILILAGFLIQISHHSESSPQPE
ncbi:MauE/DoxX family redox-associated membrane protein [Gracilimonas mengyeensis]|uniref:Methylamine utilisation protein MauE domain-containing protein n=1 Tax=Gracilimonas mengyeensis TaxID=1302730 RepID=A0A521CD00_9BACT|nr:MauE/DoxX family redox-associated membrane protein [Gracilimonas mengyeensis]SMO56640.1 hypothetical protein SAMN06265219_1058 [Gracilimonas mengyeensis]